MTPETIATADADRIERQLLDRLTSHPVLQTINTMSHEQFLAMLLQRRFISLIFAPVYDMGIDALADTTALTLVRQILREEYPGQDGTTMSHREDLVHDLGLLGAPKADVLACRPSAATVSVLVDTLELMAEAAATDTTDLKVLTMLRFWGEVVVSVEYGEYWTRMAGRFDPPDLAEPRDPDRRSRFYYAHYSHDGSEPLAAASAADVDNLDATHSRRLGASLIRLLGRPGTTEAFAEVETQVLKDAPAVLRPVLTPAVRSQTRVGIASAASSSRRDRVGFWRRLAARPSFAVRETAWYRCVCSDRQGAPRTTRSPRIWTASSGTRGLRRLGHW